jgi:hypothetical protein
MGRTKERIGSPGKPALPRRWLRGTVPPLGCLLLGLLLVCLPAAAQEHDHRGSAARVMWGAQVVPVLTHASPTAGEQSLTEAYLTQPNLMAHLLLWGGRLQFAGTLNLEGLTLDRGELTPGAWGEGYVDRRHPHTYLHELIAVARLYGSPEGRGELTFAAGKGFAPFGTDDPMVRPFVKFPVNHHHAQILERLVGIAALRAGPAIVEAGVFSGDEPTTPTHVGTVERFGDSWAARGTLLPLPGLELSGSYAFLASPEFPAGSGIDRRQRSAAIRYGREARPGDGQYLLAEWAHMQNYILDERFHAFDSWLAEAAVQRRGTTFALRYERTVRPEEERTADPFRTPVPHAHVYVIGATRWQIVTAAASREWSLGGGARVRPFVEVARAGVTETLGSLLFAPSQWYGSERLWSFSAGMRLEAGMIHPRMGRYGAAVPALPRGEAATGGHAH